MSDTVHQGQITREAAHAEGLSQRLLKETAQQILSIIREALLRDGQVRIHQFGTFRLRWVKAHRSINPQTGETVMVPAHPRALFSPAKALRQAVQTSGTGALRASKSRKPKPVPLGVAASRLRTPTIVKRAHPDAPTEGEGKPQIRDSAGASLDQQDDSGGDHRPWLVLAGIAVIALAVLLVFWPGGGEPPTLVDAPTPAPIDRSSDTDTDLSIAFAQTQDAMDRVASESSDPEATAHATAAGPTQAEASPGDWLVGAIDRTIRRSDERTDALPPALSTRETEAAVSPHVSRDAGKERDVAPATAGTVESGPFFQGRDYEVVSGDNLWNLSGQHYVRPYYWPHIYNANRSRIRNPNLIRSGSNLRLPSLYGHPDALTGDDRRSIAEGYFLLYRLFKRTSDPDAVFALSAVSHFDKSVIRDHEKDIQASHGLEVEIAESYGMRIGERIFVAHENVRFPTRLFD